MPRQNPLWCVQVELVSLREPADAVGRSSNRTWQPPGLTRFPTRVSRRLLLTLQYASLVIHELAAEAAAYGRYLHAPHPPHLALLNNPSITHYYRRVFLRPYSAFPTYQEAYDSTEIIDAEDVDLTPEELASGSEKGGRWVCYSVWEMKEEPTAGWTYGGKGLGRDVVLVHGAPIPPALYFGLCQA